MTNNASISSATLERLVSEKLRPEDVRNKLLILGYGEETINFHLKEFKKAIYVKRRTQGFIFIGIGAFCGFLSCLLSIINPIPALYHWILCGMTSIAILIVVIGMYYILEG